MLLENEIRELIKATKHWEKVNPDISRGCVGWHIDHSLRVIIGVCKSIKNSDPKGYRWAFNWKRILIFTIGYIPRGIARAPKTVVAHQEISSEEIDKLLLLAREELKDLNALNKNAYFDHPYFGLLPLHKTKRFLNIHTEHHLKIIRDIIRDK